MRIVFYSVLLCLLTMTVYAQTIEKVDDTHYQETTVAEKSVGDLAVECASYQSQIASLQFEIDRRTEQMEQLQSAASQCSQKLDTVQSASVGSAVTIDASGVVSSDKTADTNWSSTDMIGN